jgi:hypothetical protein
VYTFILFTATSVPETIKRKHIVAFQSNGYGNIPQCNIIHTLCTCLKHGIVLQHLYNEFFCVLVTVQYFKNVNTEVSCVHINRLSILKTTQLIKDHTLIIMLLCTGGKKIIPSLAKVMLLIWWEIWVSNSLCSHHIQVKRVKGTQTVPWLFM